MTSLQREQRYDAALIGILKEEGKITSFLDVIFGFLYERTDFYLDLEGTGGKLGFKPGQAEQIILKAFRKYKNLAQQDEERRKIKDKPKAKEQVSNDATADMTTVGSEVEIASENENNSGGAAKPKKSVKKMDEKTLATHRIQPDCFNGAVLDNYNWSQSITDIDVRIPVPSSITSSKMVRVELDHKHLKASIKDSKEDWKILVDENFTWKINLEKSMWTFVPGEHIHVNLEKCEERWWDSLLVGEPKIDVTQIDSERPLEDLGDEEQAKIGELMYNQRQKQLGKPTSEEEKIHEMMKEAWNKPGSPFQGQPFDPSLYNLSGGNPFQSDS